MKLTDTYPGFEKPPVQFDCSRPYCDNIMLIHIGSIHPAPESDGLTVSITHKCLNRECGNIEKASPAINENESQHLLSFWDRRKEFFWTRDEFLEQHVPEELTNEIMERLNALGYM